MRALPSSFLILFIAATAHADEVAPSDAKPRERFVYVAPLPTVVLATVEPRIFTLVAGVSIPAGPYPITLEVAPVYSRPEWYLDGGYSVGGAWFRAGTRFQGDVDANGTAVFFLEPKLEVAGFAAQDLDGSVFATQGAALVGADVGVRFWLQSRAYVALVLGASGGVCTNCGTDFFFPLTFERFSEDPRIVWSINPNLLRIGATF